MSWGPIAAMVGGNLLGGMLGDRSQQKAAQSNEKLQRDFAQAGIQWKVKDAKAAGIHPLYALGAQTHMPSSVYSGDSPVGKALADSGQDIGRSLMAARTEEDRTLANLNIAAARTNLEGAQIDNAIKASQLQKMNQNGPAMAGSTNFIPGQGNSGLQKVNPSERTASQPGRLAQEAGWRPDVSYARTDTGLTPMVPEVLSESLEDDLIGKAMWRIRNQLVPNFTGGGAPPKSQLPKGYQFWYWSHSKQEWQPGRDDRVYQQSRVP